MFEKFNVQQLNLTKYLFFTGKGGVGKTSVACATAITLADQGKKIMLVSTDPASNLQDVFNITLNNKGVVIREVPGLIVANFNPEEAAKEYKESVVAPYRGKLPVSVINNMEEQLSGSCTVEIAAFNEFCNFITDEKAKKEFDHIIFDTAPTGHTLRMLQLPSAWSHFISENTHGVSCLGQLSGLESRKEIYKQAVKTLADQERTTLILVSRPAETPLKEAERASKELQDIGIHNQILIINGMLKSSSDKVSFYMQSKQEKALQQMPKYLKPLKAFEIPLRPYNISGIKNVRALLNKDQMESLHETLKIKEMLKLKDIVEDLYTSNKKVIFTMGKGGVGKTTIAAAIAIGLAQKGKKVHLTTTDPAAHLKFVLHEASGITMSRIDEKEELEKYRQEVLTKARETMSEEDLEYVEEDLRSPCTQEIAVFRAFAQIVEHSKNEVVVIDTAPTGHTLLLLDSTKSYHKEIKRSQGNVPESVKKLLPTLRDKNETEVIIVTLAEATPVYEASRLLADLNRAGIDSKWWVINSSLYATGTTDSILKAKANEERIWINKVSELTENKFALIEWKLEDIKDERLLDMLE